MKKTPDIRKQYEDLAPCDNDRCPARKECLRLMNVKLERDSYIWCGGFPIGKNSQHCRYFKRVKR